jgi:hypothetical protein
MAVTDAGWPAFAVCIYPTVDRVAQQPIEAPIAGALPLHLALGCVSGKLQAMLLEPQQRLPQATDLDDLLEQQLDRLPHAPIRGLLE